MIVDMKRVPSCVQDGTLFKFDILLKYSDITSYY